MPQIRANGRPLWRRALPLTVILASTLALSGCATAVIGSVTVSQISTAAGIASAATTGKGLQDHALSIVTGQDCRLLEGIFREDRNVCEEPGSPATENDFRGVVVMLMGPPNDATPSNAAPEVIYAGLSSDYRPSLTRRARQQGVIGIPITVQNAAYVPAQLQDQREDRPTPIRAAVLRAESFPQVRPSLRPSLGPVEDGVAIAAVELATVSHDGFAPMLVRTARRSGHSAPLQLAETETMPLLSELNEDNERTTRPRYASVELILD